MTTPEQKHQIDGEPCKGASEQKHPTYGGRFKIARKYADLTQQELANQVGISQAAVHKLEANQFKSSRNTIKIAKACNVDPFWLETGEGKMAVGENLAPERIITNHHDIDQQILVAEKLLEQAMREITKIKHSIIHLQPPPAKGKKHKT